MNRKRTPLHPGKILKYFLGEISVAEAARTLRVSRSRLSRLLAFESRLSPDMAIRLGLALGTPAEYWVNLQLKVDLFEAGKLAQPKIEKFKISIESRSLLDQKGTLLPALAHKLTIAGKRVALPQDLESWDASPPTGREFGSPYFERLDKLDALAFEVLGSVKRSRKWLDTPHPALGGAVPNCTARSKLGYLRVALLLEHVRNDGT